MDYGGRDKGELPRVSGPELVGKPKALAIAILFAAFVMISAQPKNHSFKYTARLSGRKRERSIAAVVIF
jgi:hypothetical protein